MKVYGVVYLIWNMKNGKRYVGQTVQRLDTRFNGHRYAHTAIGNAINKYGKARFRYGVIKSCASREELNYWEKWFIVALKSKYPNGYNMTDGGEGGIPCKEVCVKMSISRLGNKNRLGKPHDAASSAKMSAARIGKHHSAATRSKMSATRRTCSPYRNLIAELDAHQLSYRALGTLLGISNMTVSGKMRCKQKFTANEIAKLVEIFRKPAEYLLQRDDQN